MNPKHRCKFLQDCDSRVSNAALNAATENSAIYVLWWRNSADVPLFSEGVERSSVFAPMAQVLPPLRLAKCLTHWVTVLV
jgi:hypothetical protein